MSSIQTPNPLSAPMQSEFRLPNRRTGTAASLLLLLAVTLVVLVARHVTVGVEIGSAEPAIEFVNKLRPIAAAKAPTKIPLVEKKAVASKGPGGSQPWVRWNYIP